MYDTRSGVAALEVETLVEADAVSAQLADPGRRLFREEPDGARPTQAAACGKRVGRMKSRVVVGAERGGDTALRRVAVRARVRSLREDEHRGSLVGGGERRRESGDTGPDDDHVGRVAFLPHNR
jgi:hypothetical protein